MVFDLRFFPRKLEKKVVSNPTILKSKDLMIDIPQMIFALQLGQRTHFMMFNLASFASAANKSSVLTLS